MNPLEPVSITCPHCWQTSKILLDITGGSGQCYIQDCEVCCNPLEISFDLRDGQVTDLSVQDIGQ